MFFIGPGYPQIDILNYIYERAGWFIESGAMIAATTLAGYIVFTIFTLASPRPCKEGQEG